MSDTRTDDGKEEVEIELSEEHHAYLLEIAASRGVTIDEIVEDILRDAVARCEAENAGKDPESPA